MTEHEDRAAYLAAAPEVTFRDVLRESPAVVAALRQNYAGRWDALESADAAWNAAGRPAGMLRTAPVATGSDPRPAPRPELVPLPDPATATLKDIRDPRVFAAFAAAHPDRLSELVAASRGSAPNPNGR